MQKSITNGNRSSACCQEISGKWMNSPQMPRLYLNEDVDFSSDDDSRTPGQRISPISLVQPEETKPIHFSFFMQDLQKVLAAYKSRAAIVIQKAFRAKRLKCKAKIFTLRFVRLLRRFLLETVSKVNGFTLVKESAARLIQRTWRNFLVKKQQIRTKRKILAKAVSIGKTLRRMNSMILEVHKKRAIIINESVNESVNDNHIEVTPVKQKRGSVLYKNRSEIKLHRSNSCLKEVLKDILIDESINYSIDTIPEIAFDTLIFKATEEGLNAPKSHSDNTVIMTQSPLKIRTKKPKLLKLDDFFIEFHKDLTSFHQFSPKPTNSSIPTLTLDSKFLSSCSPVSTKASLSQSYLSLINP